MIVADASFTGAWFLPDESTRAAEDMLKDILAGKEELALPDLWSYEMVNLLLSALKRKRIHEDQIAVAIQILESIPCSFYDHQSLLARNRIAAFARRYDLSAYDACYLELADRLQCKLYSSDNALSKAAKDMGLPK